MINRSKIGNGWSKYDYYIFAPTYNFDGKIKDASDFVLNVRVNCYGVLAAPGMPYLFKCKTKQNTICLYYRKDYEIFNTFEEALSSAGENFQKKWIEKAIQNSIADVEFTEGIIKREKKELKARRNRLKALALLVNQ